ncbi:hypothetical protein EG329_009714 [Mollisiaceae sp. DMI_Dod_QoI]|nr:hypothetical protein EG329_009714 [Helotiales sp. DMI_Dod_QoI]
MSFKNTILVTGGTQGLGYYASLELARTHPENLIIIASRTDPLSSAKTINTTLHQANVLFLPLDLNSFSQIRSFVSAFQAKNYPSITTLLLNAGIQFPKGIRYTADGFEATFGVNHVGHALLFHLLYPFLAEDARVVVTASGTHDPAQKTGIPDAVYDTAEEVAHPKPGAERINGRQRYATSKLTNVLWMYALNRRLEARGGKDGNGNGKRMSVVAFDPGLMPGTGLAREGSGVEKFVWIHVLPRLIWLLRRVISPNIWTPQESGRHLASVAVGEEFKGETGVYFEGRQKIKSSVVSYDVKKQEDLWEWTIKNVSSSEEERKRFDIGK